MPNHVHELKIALTDVFENLNYRPSDSINQLSVRKPLQLTDYFPERAQLESDDTQQSALLANELLNNEDDRCQLILVG